MQMLLYILFICLIIWLVLSLLPIILPIVLIIVIVLSVYLWNIKRKIVKHMDTYSEEMNAAFKEDTTYTTHANTSKQEDIIDVEYTESEDRGE